MSKRCDQVPHCHDESDELNCQVVLMKSNYNKNIAPFTADPATDTIAPVQVNVSAKIIDILKISEVEQVFEVKIQLILSWYDYRLTFNNLKTKKIANKPTWEETERIWIPNIIFANTKNNDVIVLD